MDARVAQSQRLDVWIDSKLEGLSTPSDIRSLLSSCCMDIVFEHHRAIGLLVANGLVGSAFALVRVVFEAYIRGLWIDRCATEEQLGRFEKDRLNIIFGEMINAVEQTDGFDAQILSQAKKSWWSPMNSFTHSGFAAVSRRVVENEICAKYEDSEVCEALNFVDAIATLALGYVAQLANNQILAEAVLRKLDDPAAD